MNAASKDPLKLLVSIVERGRGQTLVDFCDKNGIKMNFLCHGVGTASSELLNLLGLGNSERDVVASLVPQTAVPTLLSSISKLMSVKSLGKGVAVTIPICAINAYVADYVNQEVQAEMGHQDRVKREVGEQVEFCLILTVYNAGFTDEVVAVAKAAGATGGTLMHARGAGSEKERAFFGIAIQEEKEVLAMFAPTENSRSIMEAINLSCGLKKEPRAIVLSLPVHDMVGLGYLLL